MPYQVKGIINNGKSETIPDQSLTIKELLLNHTRGINTEINQPEPEYFETPIPQITDPVELAEHLDMLKQNQLEIQQQAKKEIQAKKEQNAKEASDKAKKEIMEQIHLEAKKASENE